jgi:hypothetical protein
MGSRSEEEPEDEPRPVLRGGAMSVSPRRRAVRLTCALVAFVALTVLASACAKSPSPAASSGSPQPLPVLKLDVLTAVGNRLSYCDPDIYPVAHGSPLDAAKARLPTIQSDQATYQAILAKEGIASGASLTDEQILAVNQDYKQAQAIDLQASGGGYAFTVYVPSTTDPAGNQSVSGTVSRDGSVELSAPGPGKAQACPICLARGVLIATPSGQVPVQDMRAGMAVWTTDRQGRRIEGFVLVVGHTLAPLGHEVVRVTLADGRTVVASPGHPTADGRTIGSLRIGDSLDGSGVVSAVRVPYTGTFTYDLLPSGPTGTYFADGVLLGSTLAG